MMRAMFNDVKAYAKFHTKPHLFAFSAPYQIGVSGADQAVFINLESAEIEMFKSRVEQFGGIIVNETAPNET